MVVREQLQFNDPNSYTPGDILVSDEQVTTRLRELASDIAKQYEGKELLVVGLLKGGFMVTSDLVKELHDKGLTDMEITFMGMKSYLSNTTAVQEPVLQHDIDINPKGRHVLLVDDIADTRRSLLAAHTRMTEGGAASVASFVLFNKPERKEVDFPLDFIGFTIPNIWLQGRGMDTREKGRGNRRVIVGPYLA